MNVLNMDMIIVFVTLKMDMNVVDDRSFSSIVYEAN